MKLRRVIGILLITLIVPIYLILTIILVADMDAAHSERICFAIPGAIVIVTAIFLIKSGKKEKYTANEIEEEEI